MNSPETSNTHLWILLTAFLYSLFTLIPDSHSLMVQWPWVAVWQIGLLCPIFWLMSQIWHQNKLLFLGNRLDPIVGIMSLGIILSSFGARFPVQARWYGWAAFGLIAALYALAQYLDNNDRRYKLLLFQAYLSIGFIVCSLLLWTTGTLFPELNRLGALKSQGVDLPFDFSVLELRNWAPLGHQNYVAGYLLLVLPLLIAFAFLESKRRPLWITGVVLGLVSLYTTSSRGGWLGLLGLTIFALGVLLLKSKLRPQWLPVGSLGAVLVLFVFVISNNRLQTALNAIVNGQVGDEFAYRIINSAVGWQMGSQHPITGIGLGNVPLVYQNYRPYWAGRTSELIYQLHSTPVQIWAELGIVGVVGMVLLLCWLVKNFLSTKGRQPREQILIYAIYGALSAYGLMSLTDYQLDNIAISGTLIIYLACLASWSRQDEQIVTVAPKYLFFSLLGAMLVALIWLIPIHRAWQLSSQGFMALADKKIDVFETALSRASQLAPWESYYPLQLGWNLADIGMSTNNRNLLAAGVDNFEKANTISPYQEFGRSNLGWLVMGSDPVESMQSFLKSAQLVPAKRGVFYGLGLSLLRQQKLEPAIDAFAIESIRDPIFLTSPIWRLPQFVPIYQKLIEKVEGNYGQLLQNRNNSATFNSYLHHLRGGFYWWIGDKEKAKQDWSQSGTIQGDELLAGKVNSPPLSLLLQAWNEPTQRQSLLRQAWALSQKTALPQDIEKALLTSMERATSFEQWVKENAPPWQYRRERAGFNVNSRHIDGIQPTDFTPVIDNLVIATWFQELLGTSDYMPPLDQALQPLRQALINQLSKK
ncbi:MAG: hypothetical protein N5P05_001532 [Chroococcopsis gigantea SAG 12.99]|jgi:uncharacterized protein involved in response to NO|nr:O-antigen ligase family protein [Chlorogloea purpurea SAG 13.99]MDV2999926.1 hypothetical protein [Chroococcopsis gigantea SAG 12.99]